MATYTYTWRNKFLTVDAKSIGEIAAGLETAASELRAMEADGVVLRLDGGVHDDYANLVTEDSSVATEYGFEEEE